MQTIEEKIIEKIKPRISEIINSCDYEGYKISENDVVEKFDELICEFINTLPDELTDGLWDEYKESEEE